MRLSSTSRYAIRVVVRMAQLTPGTGAVGHKLAEDLKAPAGFLLHVLVSLARAGLLLSMRGPGGGYRLARPAREISLLDVIEAAEGPVRGKADAVGTKGTIGPLLDRRLEELCEQAAAIVRRQLAAISIEDLARKAGGKGKATG